MKIEFSDKSFIECKKSETTNKIIIMIQAKDFENPLKKITNVVELTYDEFKSLINILEVE